MALIGLRPWSDPQASQREVVPRKSDAAREALRAGKEGEVNGSLRPLSANVICRFRGVAG
jgi:hypothetical protein